MKPPITLAVGIGFLERVYRRLTKRNRPFSAAFRISKNESEITGVLPVFDCPEVTMNMIKRECERRGIFFSPGVDGDAETMVSMARFPMIPSLRYIRLNVQPDKETFGKSAREIKKMAHTWCTPREYALAQLVLAEAELPAFDAADTFTVFPHTLRRYDVEYSQHQPKPSRPYFEILCATATPATRGPSLSFAWEDVTELEGSMGARRIEGSFKLK